MPSTSPSSRRYQPKISRLVTGEGEGRDTANDGGGTGPEGEPGGDTLDPEDEDADDHKPLSDILIRDLTAHRTLGLRLALSEPVSSHPILLRFLFSDIIPQAML